jgi:DNA-binding IclR family transcriptional regulator
MEVLRELSSQECLRRGGLGVVRIAVRLGREKSQVSRALHALEDEGLVERNPRTRTYHLGWGLYTLAARGVESRLVRAASIHLSRLAEAQWADVRLCVLIGEQVLTLISMPTEGTAKNEAPSQSPCGPVLALDWPEAALAGLVPADASGGRSLVASWAEARAQGYLHFPETDSGPARYAAPVRDHRGVVLAAIELAPRPTEESPATRPPPGQAVLKAANELSADLGYRS